MTFGLSSTGFLRMLESDVLEAIDAEVRPILGIPEGSPITPDSVAGQIDGVVAHQLGLLWEALEAIYHSQYPNSATGIALDNLAALENITRLPATATEVLAMVQGDEGTLVPAGTRASVVPTGSEFEAQADATISRTSALRVKINVSEVANTTLYRISAGGVDSDFTSDASATNLEIAAGLTSSVNASAAPVTAVDHLDGTLTITVDDSETPLAFDVDPQELDGDERLEFLEIWTPQQYAAVDAGPVPCLAGTLTQIETPVSGFDAITNLQDGELGRNLETDTELRLRRKQVLSLGGRATLAAILSHILADVEDVTAATIYENNTDVIDGAGRPPHSFEVVVQGGTDQDVAQSIWENKPAGIQTYGNTSAVVVDSNGDNQTVNFSRPVPQYIHLDLELTLYSEEDFPTDGLVQVEAAVLEYALANHPVGKNVLLQRFLVPTFGIPGIASAVVTADATAAPLDPPTLTGADIAIGAAEVAVFDSSRIDAHL